MSDYGHVSYVYLYNIFLRQHLSWEEIKVAESLIASLTSCTASVFVLLMESFEISSSPEEIAVLDESGSAHVINVPYLMTIKYDLKSCHIRNVS